MKSRKKLHPYIFIILTYLGSIAFGTLLLIMPFASKSGESFGFIDSFFMSTSAVCVTGLSVLKNGLGADMTIYAKIVMILLMEIGGLSIITIAVFFFTVLGAKIGVSSGYMLKESLNQNNLRNILSLVKEIIVISFSIQSFCTLLNIYPFYEYLSLHDNASFFKALGFSIFHSAAAFNNAGFDILYGSSSFLDFSNQAGVLSNFSVYMFNFTTMFMIYFGGIGFVVIEDIINKKNWINLRLHTKITIIMTTILLVLGTIIIKFTANVSFLDAMFTAFTSRTAGFQTIDMKMLDTKPASYITIIFMMFVGASPCSTGGGIKTTTFALIFIAIYYFAKGKKTKLFNRRIDDSQIGKAFVLVNLAIILVVFNTFLVILAQPDLGLIKVLFEVVSAFSTTGLSMGITSSLNAIAKLIMIFLMIFGRLGILTIIGVLNKNWLNGTRESIEYVKESVIVG